MSRQYRTLTALLWVAALAAAAPALAGTMTAELSRTEGELGQTFAMTVTVSGQLQSQLSMPEVPGLVFRQTGTHNTINQLNGQTTVEHAVSFLIYPQKSGNFTVPGIRAIVDGTDATTLPLTLTVKPSSGQPNNNAQGGQQKPQEKRADDTGGVFIERECTADAPYVGEQVVCAVRVFHRGNLRGGQRVSENSADFRRFSIEGEKQYQKQVNNQRYVVIELREILVPGKSGDIEVPPFVLDARVAHRQRVSPDLDRFFDHLGGGGFFNFDMAFEDVKNVQVKTPRQVWKVKPLPDAGKPPGFSGVVGHYQLSAGLSKARVNAGDTVTITVEARGEGILDALSELKPPVDAVGRVYADKPAYNEEADADQGIRSRKTFKYALVPAKAGQYQLGKLQLPVFDPKLGQYMVLEADLGQLIVDPGKAEEKPLVVGATPAATPPAKKDVQVLNQDILGPHRELALHHSDELTARDAIWLATAAGGPMGFGFACAGFVAWRARQGQGETREKRRAKAARRALSELDAAQKTVDSGAAAALAAAHRAFRAYIADKLGLPGTALAAKELVARMAELPLGEETRTRAAKLIERLEQVEFGGRVPDAQAARGWIDELAQCIKEIDAR